MELENNPYEPIYKPSVKSETKGIHLLPTVKPNYSR